MKFAGGLKEEGTDGFIVLTPMTEGCITMSKSVQRRADITINVLRLFKNGDDDLLFQNSRRGCKLGRLGLLWAYRERVRQIYKFKAHFLPMIVLAEPSSRKIRDKLSLVLVACFADR